MTPEEYRAERRPKIEAGGRHRLIEIVLVNTRPVEVGRYGSEGSHRPA